MSKTNFYLLNMANKICQMIIKKNTRLRIDHISPKQKNSDFEINDSMNVIKLQSPDFDQIQGNHV